ncbi:hypothetical protein GBZ48_24785 [Azospirillum melinis]|uniref:Uncharacterized protein n=1 Tax=Azospirillum melinis TaxID=328839 RepID=A0ABX2KIB5_9PROT|nr:hypothetical protein [Azospirillum melinis]MBP2307749.1 hypothetical protein [Azospirillum melinis]NUB02466.1 hypothetical protein [Azospirillum melinis]
MIDASVGLSHGASASFTARGTDHCPAATGGYVKDMEDMPPFRDGIPPVAAGADRPLDIRA